MNTRRLGSQGLVVSEMGLGCMGMTWAYGTADPDEARATLRRALELGVTFFDTAEAYGPRTNEELIGPVLRPVRDRVVLATKFGFRFAEGGISGLDSRPENVRRACEGSLRRLGVDTIDLLYQHRVDPAVPIEETVGAMAALVKEGKVRHLGLSEAGPATIRRAHAVHPITALQSEYSLWTRDHEAPGGALDTCRELGIGFVAYSPLGRGFLTGTIPSPDALEEKDWRRSNPRFQADAMAANRRLADAIGGLAERKGATAAQVALAWVLSRGDDVVPIPGTRRVRWMEENAAATGLTLSAEDVAFLDRVIPRDSVTGARYSEGAMKFLDTAR